MISVKINYLKLGFGFFVGQILFFLAMGNGQNNVDSLLLTLEKPISDSNKASIYFSLAEAYFPDNPDSAYFYGKQSNLLAENIEDNNLLALSYGMIGMSLAYTSKRDSAEYYLLSSLEYYKQIGNSIDIAKAFFNLGLLAKLNGEYENSLKYYQEGISHAISEPDSKTLGNLYSGLGSLYRIVGDTSKAINSLIQGLEVRVNLNDGIGIGQSHVNIGNLYAQTEQFQLAEYEYRKALNHYQDWDYEFGIIRVKNNIGNLLYEQGRIKDALPFFEEILESVESIGDLPFKGSFYSNYGSILYELENYSLASSMFEKGLELVSEDLNPSRRASLLKNIAYSLSQEGKSLKAFKFLTEYTRIQESILEEKQNTIDSDRQKDLLNAQLEFDKKQLEQNNRYLTIGILVGILFLLIGISWLLTRLRARRRQDDFENRIARLIKDQEQSVFGAMIHGQERAYTQIAKELHDNIGMLLSATNLHFSNLEDKLDSQLESYQQAKSTLLQAVKEVRSLSRDILSDPLNYAGLVKALKDLLEVVRNSSQYQVVYETYGLEQSEIPPSVTHTIYRCVQELVSNVIKHAHATGISLVLNVEDDVLHAVFRDNGVGFNVQEQLEAQGIGLGNLSERMEEVNGTCTIMSEIGQGTEVRLTVPLPASKSEWLAEQSQKQ